MTIKDTSAIDGPGFSESRLHRLSLRLIAFFRRGGSNMTDAEDLAQDVLARLVSPTRTDSQRSDAYIFTVARNLQRDGARRIGVRRQYGRSVDQDAYPLLQAGGEALDAERVLIGKQEVTLLVEGLGELSDRTREIFLLYRLEGRSHREIAMQLGLSISSVEKNIAKAMVHLVQKMDRSK